MIVLQPFRLADNPREFDNIKFTGKLDYVVGLLYIYLILCT